MEMSIAPPKEESIQIREVWNDNLEEEFALIREIVDQFSYVAMDTEFPGVVLRPVGNFKNINDYNYQTLKDKVDMLKLIQLGLTFSDENGNLPTCGTDKLCIWQFNFREFNVTKDIFTRLFLDDSEFQKIQREESLEPPPKPPQSRNWRGSNVAPFAGNNMLVLHSCPVNPASKYFVQVLHNEHPIPMAGCNGSDFCPFEEFKEKIVAPQLKHDYNSVCTVQPEEPEHKPATSKLSRLFGWLFAMQNDDTLHTKDEL